MEFLAQGPRHLPAREVVLVSTFFTAVGGWVSSVVASLTSLGARLSWTHLLNILCPRSPLIYWCPVVHNIFNLVLKESERALHAMQLLSLVLLLEHHKRSSLFTKRFAPVSTAASFTPSWPTARDGNDLHHVTVMARPLRGRLAATRVDAHSPSRTTAFLLIFFWGGILM